MEEQATTLLFIALGAFAVPLLSGRIGVPAAVGEIAFGIMVGPDVLAIVSAAPVGETASFFEFLAEFGFAFLMFLAGLEMDFAHLERRGARVLLIGAVVASLTLALAFLGAYQMGWTPFFGVVLGAMSIGLALVTLREVGRARSDFGQTIILAGSIGEFLTIVVLTVYNIVADGTGAITAAEEVLGLVLVFVLAYTVLRTLRLLVWWFPARFSRMIEVEDPSEIGVRAGLALMISFVAVSELLDIEFILGAFLAGALFSFVFREKGILETKLAGIGHGFFIPVFFIHVGVTFDLGVVSLQALPLLGQILVLSLVVKALASAPLLGLGLKVRQIAGAAFLLATPLTLLVAIATVGLELGALDEMESSTVILAAVISGLLFPTAFKKLSKRRPKARRAPEPAGA